MKNNNPARAVAGKRIRRGEFEEDQRRSQMFRQITVLACALLFVASASADMLISEWMYSGTGGEFVELVNTGPAAIDMTGWSYDDDSAIPGEFDLSGFGTVQPGECVIFTEDVAQDFIDAWGLTGVSVLGGVTNNLSRNDVINIFDSSDQLVDTLAFGDETYSGSIRTKDASGNPATPAALGANDVYQWVLSGVGDAYGSYASANGDIGNPGLCVPEPSAFALLLVAPLFARRR